VTGAAPRLTDDTRARYDAMCERIAALGDLLVAFSGGVDSTLLLRVAHDVLGDGAVALTAVSPSFPDEEREAARLLAARIGVRQIEIDSREYELEGYRRNEPDRCYFCKSELFELCERAAKDLGFGRVAFGAIGDDLGDHRPGMQAAAEAGVLSPLADAGLSKSDVRALSYALELETWDKPSFACLASRIPFGTEVTVERLRRVGRAEGALRELGLRDLRVRDHHPVARVELAAEEWERLLDPALRVAADAACRGAGFSFASLDLRPFRTGSLTRAQLAPGVDGDGVPDA